MDLIYVICAAFLTALFLFWANGGFLMGRLRPVKENNPAAVKAQKDFIDALRRRNN